MCVSLIVPVITFLIIAYILVWDPIRAGCVCSSVASVSQDECIERCVSFENDNELELVTVTLVGVPKNGCSACVDYVC